MKKTLKSLALLAAAATALMACNTEIEVQAPVVEQEEVVLSFSSEKPTLVDTETRTVYTDGSIEWSVGDRIRVGITIDGEWVAKDQIVVDGTNGSFYTSTPLASGGPTGVFNVNANFRISEEGSYKFYGVYPSSSMKESASTLPAVSVTIPKVQTPPAGSFDAAADIMIATSEAYNGIPENRLIDLEWTRLVAHGDITLKKLPALASDERILNITITAQPGADLAGPHNVDITTGEVTYLESGAINAIKVDAQNLTVNTADNTLEFWFSSLPFTTSSIKIDLATNKNIYTKEYTGLNLNFMANRRNVLGIGMSNATVVEKTQLIEDGEYVISCDDEDKMMGIGADSDFRSSLALDLETTADEAIWTIEYDSENDAYTIYNSEAGKYLFGATGTLSDNRYLELKEDETYSNYTKYFTITPGSGSEAYNIAPLGNNERYLAYNTRSPYCFALYKATTTDQIKDLNLHPVSFDTTPRFEVVEQTVSLTKNAITGARVINTIKRKYYDGTIAARTSASWISVNSIGDGDTEIRANVLANDGPQRTAIVTLYAVEEGIEEKTFEVVQAAGATEVVDIIVRDLTGVTGTSYTTWSGKTSNSAAVYAGKSAGGNGAIQLTNTQSTAAGIVTTNSGGTVKSVSITWNSNTANDRKVYVYGSHTPYTSASDLHGSTPGTQIGTFIYGSSTELTVNDNYEYIGFKAVSGALFLDKIEITWGDAKQEAPISWSASSAEATIKNGGIEFVAPTLSNEENLPITYRALQGSAATVSETGVVTPVAAGEVTISAAFAGDDTYLPKTVTYRLVVRDERTFTISVIQPEDGTITVESSDDEIVSGDEIMVGTDISLTANPAEGYSFSKWVVKDADENEISVTKNHFAMPASNVTVTAEFVDNSGPTDYSTVYTSNITLSTVGGTSATECNVVVNNSAYSGIKAGTGKVAGAVKITVPSGTSKLHLHLAGWNGESVTLSVTPAGYSSNISLTANSGISSNSPFTFSGDPSSTNFYKVITFSSALASDTDLTFTATSGNRFVVWGVNSEE